MPNDIVVRSDKDGGKVHLSADRVYDLNEDKTQDVINSEFKTLMNLDSEVAIVINGRSCTLGAVAGQYVILQNSTIAGKSDGLYTAAQTIPAGATNVTAEMLSSPIPRGGLNSLNNSKVSTSAIANNLTTSAEGYVLDARQGTALKTALNQLGIDVGYLKSDIGIVEETDTAQHTIASGQYVIWKGQLYTASAAIPAGTTLSGTNLAAVSGGGLNNLRDFARAVNNRFGANTRFRTYFNTGDIQIDLGFTPSINKYGHLILFNANQNALFGISFGASIVVNKWSSTSITLTVTNTGTVIHIVPSSALWGVTNIMIDNN